MNLFSSNDDLLHFDGLQEVVLTRPGSDMRRTIAGALMRPIASRRRGEAAQHHVVLHARWYLLQEELTETPRLGDVLLDAHDDGWVISEIRNSPMNHCWRCESGHLVLHHGLDEFVDVYRAEQIASDGGFPRPRWLPWKTGLPAKRRVAELRDPGEHEFQGSRITVEFLLAENEPILPTDRLRMHDGLWLRLKSVRPKDHERWVTCVEAEVLPNA